MFALTQYAWLWAAAAAVIPVIIHLRNSKRNKTLKVGSIALVEERKIKNAGRLRLSDILLLVMRCLLFLLIALVLSSPYYLQERKTDAKGWILTTPSEKQAAYRQYKTLIDSLREAGFEQHDFAAPFPATTAGDTSANIQSVDHWRTLKQLDAVLPAGSEVFLFTGNEQRYFSGERPATSLHIKWFTVNNKEPVTEKLFAAYQTSAGTIKVIKATAGDSATIFSYREDNSVNKEFVDTNSIVVSIYAPDGLNDVQYLSAAIASIQAFTERKIVTNRVSDVKLLPANTDWLFWLSDDAIPSSVRSENVFKYVYGKTADVYEPLLVQNEKNIPAAASIYQRKLIADKEPDHLVLWSTGGGKAVLAKDNSSSTYLFYSRFNPLWSDLPWSKRFPELLADIILQKQKEIYTQQQKQFDRRTISVEQMQPTYVQMKINSIAADKKDLTNVFGLALLLLFMIERLMTYRLRKGGRYA